MVFFMNTSNESSHSHQRMVAGPAFENKLPPLETNFFVQQLMSLIGLLPAREHQVPSDYLHLRPVSEALEELANFFHSQTVW